MKVIKSTQQKPTTDNYIIRDYKEMMTIIHQKGISIIRKSDISYLKADNSYCEIHQADTNKMLCSKTMKEISEKLNSPMFLKVHRSYTVNVSKIIFIDSSYMSLTIEGGIQIPISRMRKEDLKSMLRKHFD